MFFDANSGAVENLPSLWMRLSMAFTSLPLSSVCHLKVRMMLLLPIVVGKWVENVNNNHGFVWFGHIVWTNFFSALRIIKEIWGNLDLNQGPTGYEGARIPLQPALSNLYGRDYKLVMEIVQPDCAGWKRLKSTLVAPPLHRKQKRLFHACRSKHWEIQYRKSETYFWQ